MNYMEQMELIYENRRGKIIFLFFAFLAFLLYLIFTNAITLTVLVSTITILLIYIIFNKYIWILIPLSLPLLAFGQVLSIPISVNWIYEATITEIALVIISVIFLFDSFIRSKIGKIKIDSLAFLLLIYFFIAILSLFNAIDLRLFIFGLKAVILSFISYALCLNLINTRLKIKIFLYSMTISALILSAEILIKFYQMGWSSKFFFNRSNIIVAYGPIAIASATLVLILPIIFSAYFYFDKKNKSRPFIFIIFFIGVMTVLLSLGKAAILSLFIGLFFIFFNMNAKRNVLIISLLLSVIILYIFFHSYFAGLYVRILNTFVDTNSKFRILEYKIGWELIKDNPLFGVGSGQQLLYFKKILNIDNPQLVNNFFLQSIIDYGLAGLAVIALICINIFNKAKEFIKRNSSILVIGFTASIIVAFINGLAEVTVFAMSYAIIFWSIIGVLNNLENNEENISHNNQL